MTWTYPRRHKDGLPFETPEDRRRIEGRIRAMRELKARAAEGREPPPVRIPFSRDYTQPNYRR